MTINLTGTVLSSILFEHSNSVCDKEGFLLGKLSDIITDTISDSSLNNIELQTVYYVHSFLPFDRLFSWYNSRGEVESEAMKKLLRFCNADDVIGWYKLRRNTSLMPSIRERAIHRHLEEWMKKRLVFFLCVSQSTADGALYTTDHQFMIQEGRKFRNMTVSIMNLGNISKPNYQTVSNFSCPLESSYNSVISSLKSSFVNGLEELASVSKVDTLKLRLQEKLKSLSEKLIRSEAQLGKEASELKQLRFQLLAMQGSYSDQNKSRSVGIKDALHGNALQQNSDQREAVESTGKMEDEEQLIVFDDDDVPRLKDTFHSSATKKTLTGNKHDLLTSELPEASSGSSPSHHLLDESMEALDAMKILDDDNIDENMAATGQQKIGTLEKPFEFLHDLIEVHSKASAGSLGQQNQYTSSADKNLQSDVGRIPRKTHAVKNSQMETTSKSRANDGPAQRLRKNTKKVYERVDN